MPTAASMTERGVRLFNQGRIQESLDQFTKAIALDPNYVDAWAHRAEAYARLGRGAEAAEDRRRLETLNAGSTGG
jgi:Tfp pilus assembly protein PilF